jgi:predicted transcriptional regulator
MALVQNVLVEYHDSSDARLAASRLPSRLGRTEGKNHVVLTFPGVYEADPNHEIVEDFERSLVDLSRTYRRWGNRLEEAAVSVEEVAFRLKLSESRAQCAMTLLEAEGLVAPASKRRRFVITPEMRHYLYVRSPKDYIKIKAKRERRRCLIRKGRLISRATLGDRKGIRKIILGALAIVVAAVILWTGRQLRPTTEVPTSPPPGSSAPHGRSRGSNGNAQRAKRLAQRHSRRSAAARSGG